MRGFWVWGTGNTGGEALRPGKRWFAEISDFAVVGLRTQDKFSFSTFSLSLFTFNIVCGLGIIEILEVRGWEGGRG